MGGFASIRHYGFWDYKFILIIWETTYRVLWLGQQPSNLAAGIKIILPGCEIRNIYQPMKAAEPMLETYRFFLMNTKSLQMDRRFSALTADEDLEIANVYEKFSMKRVNSVVTTADLGALFVTANSVANKITKSVP